MKILPVPFLPFASFAVLGPMVAAKKRLTAG